MFVGSLFCEVVCIFVAPACDKTLIRATEEELDGWMDEWMDGWMYVGGWMVGWSCSSHNTKVQHFRAWGRVLKISTRSAR